MQLALIARRPTATNAALCRSLIDGAAWDIRTPQRALETLEAGDGALGRLDVLPTLDGVEDGLWALGALAARGVHVLNDASALLATHDKLLTARILRRHLISHPTTTHIRPGRVPPTFVRPVVIKPRFGSWGSEVHRCDDPATLAETIERLGDESWFQRHGAVMQELVPPHGYDLRVLVAAGRVVGAVHRIAAPGEWRTNVNLGAVRKAVEDPPRDAVALALAAAHASGADLVGVDLLPAKERGWVVIELNGAVEFTSEYSEWFDVFSEAALSLQSEILERRNLARAPV
jgi:RimK family alpha-L-glutamate ligase